MEIHPAAVLSNGARRRRSVEGTCNASAGERRPRPFSKRCKVRPLRLSSWHLRCEVAAQGLALVFRPCARRVNARASVRIVSK